MRNTIINYLKVHPHILSIFWAIAGGIVSFIGYFIKIEPKMAIFSSFGGRRFDDSPKAIYDELCKRKEFEDWLFVWAFVEPDTINLARGKKVKIDTISFFKLLLKASVWVSNTGMDRGLELKRKNVLRVETWHGTPLKKIAGEENQTALGIRKHSKKKFDRETIRCAQSEYDQEIFSRIFNADKECILLCDLPRNDGLLKYTDKDIKQIKSLLKLPENKKIILYVPTYREYLIKDDSCNTLPINLLKWKEALEEEYVVLFRAHYAVIERLKIQNSSFIRDVSNYPTLNDLYAVSDCMISDYSSTFFDYALLERPMFCFAYDLDEYKEKRGLYLKLEEVLPCDINRTEDSLLENIKHSNWENNVKNVKNFREKYAPFAGSATNTVVDEIERRLL